MIQIVRIVTMLLKSCILLAIFLGHGLCESEKNISRNLNGTVIGNKTLTSVDGPYLVTSDLIVPENATLTIEPGVIVNFVPSAGIRVRGSFHAKGTPSQRITFRAVPCEETDLCNLTDWAKFYSRGVRLVDGTSYNNGRLELQYNGRWGTLCNNWKTWDISDTQVACRQLGFLGAKRYYYDPGSGPVMMKYVNCKGTEKSLWDCPYTWILNDPYSCSHRLDVGIECDTLLSYLAEIFYWKGIYFEPTNSSEKQGISSLVHVDIENALEGVNAVTNAPELLHVTINDSASGVNVKELAKPLVLVDSSILRPTLAGVSIESSGGNVVIENVTVERARFEGGLIYKRLAVNLCSVIPEKASFPLLLDAVGNHHPVTCNKVFRASPGRKISLHLRTIDGSGFELNITDASTAIKTQLHRITSDYNGRTIKTGSSFNLELSFNSKGGSKASANLEMIIMEDKGETLSLVISNSTFSDNFKSGITVDNLIGNSRVSQTKVTGNNYYGLYASNTQGKISVVASVFLRNKYNGVNITKMTGTLELINVNSSKNQASGIVIDVGTLSFQMSDSFVEENAGQGLHIVNQVNSTININGTQFIRNSNGEGVHLQALRYCQALLAEVLSLGNSQNGALLARLSDTRLNVSSCKFDGNSETGVHVDYFLRGGLNLENVSTSNNNRYGYIFHFGDTSINIESSSSFGNGRDGFYVENQEGEVVLKDFAARANRRHGLQFLDKYSARLRSVYLLNCNVSENSQYGVQFYLTYRFTEGTENYTIKVANSTIFNNRHGGCTLDPAGCGRGGARRQRRVQLLFTGNEVKRNKKKGLDILGPEWYELSALLTNNIFYENSGPSLIVRHGQSCRYEHSSPYKLQVSSNIFLKNRGENIFFVDCETLPTKCHVTIRNNTFLDNQRIRQFSNNYLRTKTQAVLAVQGGNVTIKCNSFSNPLFSYELAALLKDNEHAVQAEENWWGTRDECKIKDRLFDFEDRVELAKIHYYPFLDSNHSTSAKLHNGVRPFCFLRGDKLGGTLNQVLNITNQIDAYRVISDVTILSDGVLHIEENVTLEFPLKSVFLVQGKVIIKGTEKERVKFIPKGPLNQDIRLVGGPAPWEGVVETWVNRTWMPVCIRTYRHEYDIVCQQLGYEPVYYYRHDPSGKEKIFLHNVRCDTDQGDNITICNKNNWISSSSCSANVLYVACKIPYWAGIHLAATSKESVVSNVEVRYAGFPYRDDLMIPGIAFRVDLPRHTISGVSVRNSASIGFQIMYPDPVEDSYKIANSTIAKTESDGIRLESPFFELLGATVVNTKGYGFSYRYNWNALNKHVVTMADATVKKFMDMCNESERFIDDSSVVHYLVVTAKSKTACEAIITVPQEYTIGLQLIYHNVHGVVFHVYNQTEKPKDIYWDIHMLDWYSRPVWMSGNSSILLEKGSKYYADDYMVHFLLFLIKSDEKTEVRSPKLVISKGKFSYNTNGGIFLGGDDLGKVEIQNTEVQDTPQSGLSTAFSQVNSLKLLNCQFVRNKIGVKLSSFSGNVIIKNTKVSNSTENGLYLDSDGEKTVHIENGSVTHSHEYGLYLDGSDTKLKLSATNTFFGWNKASSVYSSVYYSCSSPYSCLTSFTNCTFCANRGPVIQIYRSPNSWQFDGNLFLNNTEGPVILTPHYTDRYYTPELFVRNNSFLFNFCQDKSVIYIIGSTKVLIIEGNIFKQNYGRSVFVEKTSPSGATIRSNIFTDNSCLNSGVIEIRRVDDDIVIVDNILKSNKGHFMVFLHCEYVLGRNMPSGMKNVTFSNNSLMNNVDLPSSSPSCEVKVSGFMERRTFFINYNRLNSQEFSKELCVSTHASSHSSIVQASLNFWGYDDEERIKARILDAEDDYEQTFADFRPYISSAGNTIKGSQENFTLNALTKSFLGGRILSNVRLKQDKSPYTVVYDVTILPKASLSIDPGVEVHFMPGVGMLVLGSLFVGGKEDQPVKFSLSKTAKEDDSLKIRLAGGKFPWEGRVEILHNRDWTSLCFNETKGNKTNVVRLICEHLGYQAPLSVNHSLQESSRPLDTCAALQCKGSELDLAKCSLSFQNLKCNTSCHLVLNCGEGRPWGNIRFLREATNTSNLSPSSLKYLRIEHCGEKHGQNVAAIEMVQYVPEVNHVTVLNCTSGGIKVWFPEKEVIITNSSFVNTGGNGTDLIITKNNVTLENIKSIKNEYGLSFHEVYGDWIDSIPYGKVNLCSPQKVVKIMDHDVFIYFRVPFVSLANLEVSCEMKVQTDVDFGFAVQPLVLRGIRYFRIDLPNGAKILQSYDSSSPRVLKKRNLIRWDSFTVIFEGWYSSEMLLQVQRVDFRDIPCSFDRDFCDWRHYPRSHFEGIALKRRWYFGGRSNYDHSYTGGNGGKLTHWSFWRSGYAALISPSILSDSNYCYLVFYYMLGIDYSSLSASLSIFYIEDNTNKSTLLWSTNDYVANWKKIIIELPNASASYSIVVLGYKEYRSYIYVDDLAFVSCDSAAAVHQVTGSVFNGNSKQGILYTTTQRERHIFRVERCQVTNNGLNPVLSGSLSGAIYLNAFQQVFEIVNNYISGNNNGGIYSKVLNGLSTTRPPVSHIHANTIEYNKGGILHVEGVSGPYLNVVVSNNYFSRNLARDWDGKANSVCIITKLWAIVQGNFFYSNVGHYVLLYDNSQTNGVGLRFVNNTLYKNGARGFDVNYGATILCNGTAEIHGNVFQNPSNRYQFSTTMRGSPVTVNATFNWWGEGEANFISALIMDKTTDYRLSITVVFQPFVRLPPQTAISVSCPPEWIKDDEMCFMYKGGSFTFSDAKKYCGSYGGNLITMLSNEDKRLIKHLRQKESLVRLSVLPSLWTISRRFLKESHSGYVQNSKVCPVVAVSGNISKVHCDEFHPFVCVRRPVIHCPNSCFHNGDCIGATCFCYPGWTGEDCSKFHCHDLHNCSGNGECMGPNVCKCYPGYLGLGCTYSFCGKYESCADCVTDPFCGWCDSSRSCRGGFPAGPPGISCPAWFYYHCYTVGDERCSRDIMRVNCKGRHCNFKDGRGTIESCQKCGDLERCHKLTEENQCRSWNETQCPGGKIEVNYTDPLRRNNVEFAKNVKFVEPNETLVYACPVILPKQDRVSLVLVAPKALKVQKGDILCSPQAGGIMHKIVKEISDGPFQLMLSAPAGLEEVIKYADFRDQVTAVQVDDDSTFEDEPDQDDLWDVISGNITFDKGQVIVLSNEIYKCLGHTYDTGKIIAHSYFLVIEKNNNIPKTGDIVVSNASDGFIETVVAVHRTHNTEYLETKFQRCEANSQWQGTRLQESKQRLSGSVSCSGGDNNEGLVLSKPEDGGRQFFVDDPIIGRPSGGLIAKVIDVYSSGNFLLVEVISAKRDGNGTITTAVDINALKSHNRRSRRSTRYDFELARFEPDGIHHKLLLTENAKVQVSLEMFFQVTMFLEIEKKWFKPGIKDATAGLELEGSLDFSLDLSVDGELRYNKGLNVLREKQLGRSIYIPVGPIKVPAGIFLEITGYASAGLIVTLHKDWNSPDPQLEVGASVKVTVTPKISVKLPAFPKSQLKAVKTSDFSLFDDLVEAVFEYVDLSMAVFVSVPLEAGLSIRLPATQCTGNKPADLESFYGISGINLGVSVGFLEKHLTLELPLGYSQMKRYSNCICPVKSEKLCVGPTTQPGPPGNGNPTPVPNPRPRPTGNGNPTLPPNLRPTPTPTAKNKSRNEPPRNGKTGELPCGKGPICAGKRTGPNCTKPDTWLLQSM
ncbi:uncharacterized protein LOC111346215 [Stylophora pistillata]|uniref:uncharacterized protein LOC111346215 n=1 Tax=Stylophora pistillata TaxID=50429 RepID=UPI000C04BA71|nr:uncharacterized protein LOC111346215 [Stylophora pistillata]